MDIDEVINWPYHREVLHHHQHNNNNNNNNNKNQNQNQNQPRKDGVGRQLRDKKSKNATSSSSSPLPPSLTWSKIFENYTSVSLGSWDHDKLYCLPSYSQALQPEFSANVSVTELERLRISDARGWPTLGRILPSSYAQGPYCFRRAHGCAVGVPDECCLMNCGHRKFALVPNRHSPQSIHSPMHMQPTWQASGGGEAKKKHHLQFAPPAAPFAASSASSSAKFVYSPLAPILSLNSTSIVPPYFGTNITTLLHLQRTKHNTNANMSSNDLDVRTGIFLKHIRTIVVTPRNKLCRDLRRKPEYFQSLENNSKKNSSSKNNNKRSANEESAHKLKLLFRHPLPLSQGSCPYFY